MILQLYKLYSEIGWTVECEDDDGDNVADIIMMYCLMLTKSYEPLKSYNKNH